ncbi:MAG: hypothetical protein WBH09_11805 [Rugosibacter sp.]
MFSITSRYITYLKEVIEKDPYNNIADQNQLYLIIMLIFECGLKIEDIIKCTPASIMEEPIFGRYAISSDLRNLLLSFVAGRKTQPNDVIFNSYTTVGDIKTDFKAIGTAYTEIRNEGMAAYHERISGDYLNPVQLFEELGKQYILARATAQKIISEWQPQKTKKVKTHDELLLEEAMQFYKKNDKNEIFKIRDKVKDHDVARLIDKIITSM